MSSGPWLETVPGKDAAQLRGLKTSTPAKSLAFPVTTTQSFALATAAIIISIALRGRPFLSPSAMSSAHSSAARESKERMRPAKSAAGPSGPRNQASSAFRFRPVGKARMPRPTSASVNEAMNSRWSSCAASQSTRRGEG